MSKKMTALIGHVLGEARTEPEINWKSVSAEGMSQQTPISSGAQPTWTRNTRKLRIAAQLSPDERQEFARRFAEGVHDHRPAPLRPDYSELLH